MKTLFLTLLFLFPVLVFSQKNNATPEAMLVQAEALHKQALFTASADVCEAALSQTDQKKAPLLYADLLIVAAANFHRMQRIDEALYRLLEAGYIVEQKDTKNSVRRLKILNGQGKCYFLASDCEKMKASIDLAISLFGNNTTNNELAETYDLLGSYWGEMGDLELAEINFKKAKAIREKNKASDPIPLHHSAIYLGGLESMRGNFAGAITLLSEALDRLEKNGGNFFDKASVLLALGYAHNGKHDYDTAIEYFREGLQLVGQHPKDLFYRVSDLRRTLGFCYRGKGDFANSKLNFEKALEALQVRQNATTLQREAAVLADYSILYANEEQYKTADSLLTLALEKMQISRNDCNWFLIQANQMQSMQATVLYYQGNYDKAIAAYQANIERITRELGPASPYLPQPLNNIGLTWHAISQYDSANVYYEKALSLLNPGRSLLEFSEAVSPIEYSYLIWNKAENHYWKYKEFGDVQSLRDAFYHFDVYVRFIDYLRNSYRAEASKVGFAADNKVAYEKCIEIIGELQRIDPNQARYESAFHYLEKSKSLILLEAVKKSQAIEFDGIAGAIKAREDSLRLETGKAENRYFNYLRRFGENAAEVATARSALFTARKNYFDFLAWLKKEHSAYYQTKYAPDVITLEKVREQLLGPDEGILQFYEGDENVYVFFISREDFSIFPVKRDFDLAELVRQFRQGIQGYHTLGLNEKTDELYAQNLKQYAEAAVSLYDNLIAPADSLISNFKKLIIIPDGQLANIPVEALLKTSPGSLANFNSYPFLIRDHEISYCYSATLLHEMEHKKHKVEPEKTILALAPFAGEAGELSMRTNTTTRDGNEPLPFSKMETEAIANLWNGDYYWGEKASEKFFKENCSDYQILHISTHGTADANSGSDSYLSFPAVSPGQDFEPLFVREVYNLSINADMVVLSACETNLGELQIGEGIVSMARAFAYAGAKSMLTTLWKVEDLATKDLMINFYKYLQSGSKSGALHAAKMDFLKGSESSRKHPYFWAAMIAVGDQAALD